MIPRFGSAGHRGALLGLIASLVVVGSLAAGAQETTLRAERTFDYQPGRAVTLGAKVGAVNVQTVEFSERRGSTGGFTTRITGGSDSETTTTVRAHVLAENATADEWQVTFTLEFLDRDNRLIDRATKKSSWEGEAKPTDLDHPLLTYVVPLIAKVRVKMEAKLD
ncbi:MAG: hypothetical protein ABIX28_19285 [Vicinamibacterales bacterium]